MIESIGIRPTVRILNKLRFFRYEQRYALAEFVDNAIQNFLDNEDKIKSVDGDDAQIEITIEFNRANDILTIKDNAAGINAANYERAFLTGEDPLDTEGLSEFGMGMKLAACWYAKNWTVETTAIGEKEKRTVEWDMDQLLDNLPVGTSDVDPDEHGTTITLRNLNHSPGGRGYGSIRDHLASIYQLFLKSGQLKLTCLGQLLSAPKRPRILHGPPRSNSNAPQEEWEVWRKDIDLELESGTSVKGFAAVANRGRTAGYGFSLFRRGREIMANYLPRQFFGEPSSGVYQRVFGELHLDGVHATFSKNGFNWNEDEEQNFWETLKTELNAKPIRILYQASGDFVRIRPDPEPVPQPPDPDPDPEPDPEPVPQPPDPDPDPDPDPEPVIDARTMVRVTIGDEEKLLDPEQQIVYFHLLPKLPENGVIKVGVTTVSGLNGRIGDPQRYFVEEVECLGVIPLGTRKEAEDKERELLEMFGRVNEDRQQCELIWDTDDVRQYIEDECEDAIFYTEASRKSG